MNLVLGALVKPQQLKEMKSAVGLLRQWQESTYQQPLLENPTAFYQVREQIAALLVDNHLGKLARKIRVLGNHRGLDSNDFLDGWSEILFFTSLWSGFDSLPDGLKLNLIYQSGPNITKRHLSKEKALIDQFIVTGIDYKTEENLLRRSVYFYALQRERFCLLVDYSYNQRPFDHSYQVGEWYEGEVVCYPFPGSVRVGLPDWKIGRRESTILTTINDLSIKNAARLYSTSLKINPFCKPFPLFLRLSTLFESDGWKVIDNEGTLVRLDDMEGNRAISFYAATYKNPQKVFVVCTENGLLPMSYYNGENLVEIVDGLE